MNKKNKALKCLLGLMALPLLGCTAIDGIGTNSSPESLSGGGTAYESAGKSSVEETSSKQSEASSSRSELSAADSSDSELSSDSQASSLASESEEPLSSEGESASSEDGPLSSEGEDTSSSLSSESETSSEDQILSSEGEAFSSEPPVESSIPSSEDILAKRKEVLDKFIENITPNNVTMEVNNSKRQDAFSYYYLGKEAYVADGGDIDHGALVNKDQGIFHFSLYYGDGLSLDYCEGLGNDITAYFITPSVVFADPDFYNYIELEGEGYSYSLNTEQMIKDVTSYLSEGTGSACLYYLLWLLGSTAYYKCVTSASLTIAPDASYADVEVKLASGETVLTYTCHLYDFGTTDVKAVSDYLANPQDIPVPTGWNEGCTEAIGKVFAGKESDIIFPTGLISASFGQSVVVYNAGSDDDVSDTESGVQWTHYGDDLTESYGALLKENGYEYVGRQKSSSDGLMHYYYRKEYAAQTEDKGALYIQCNFYYVSSTQEFTCWIYLTQDAMRYENLSLSDANAKIDEINATAEYDIPSLAESESIKSIDVADYTLVYGYTYYYAIDVFFENEDEAKAYAEAYIASISESYSDTGRYSWEDDGAVQYEVTKSSSYLVIFSLTEDEATDGTYFVEIIAAGV